MSTHMGAPRRRSAIVRALPLAALICLTVAVGTALAANISGDGTLIGTSGNDNIAAGNGNDTVYGLGGSDNISAGRGNDMIDGGGSCMAGVSSGDYPNGLPNSEYCQHGPAVPCGSDSISAGDGSDYVWGNCGPNNISVGAGNDTVYGYGGPNNISAGNGKDTIYAYDTSGASSITVGTGTSTIYAQNGVVDTIKCAKGNNATVYADKSDKVSGCATVKYTSPARDAHSKASKTRTSKKRTAKKRTPTKRAARKRTRAKARHAR